MSETSAAKNQTISKVFYLLAALQVLQIAVGAGLGLRVAGNAPVIGWVLTEFLECE